MNKPRVVQGRLEEEGGGGGHFRGIFWRRWRRGVDVDSSSSCRSPSLKEAATDLRDNFKAARRLHH